MRINVKLYQHCAGVYETENTVVNRKINVHNLLLTEQCQRLPRKVIVMGMCNYKYLLYHIILSFCGKEERSTGVVSLEGTAIVQVKYIFTTPFFFVFVAVWFNWFHDFDNLQFFRFDFWSWRDFEARQVQYTLRMRILKTSVILITLTFANYINSCNKLKLE